jgi:general stress protein 26
MSETKDQQQLFAKLMELIDDIKFAMLTTVDRDGSLRSRPMATLDHEPDGSLWFFTSASEPKVDEILNDRHVNLSYAEPKRQCYVSVSGKAKIIRDMRKTKELWNPLHKAWFPKGPDDPDLAILKIEIDKAEYWESPSSKVVQLVGFIKAVVTGTPYSGGEHEKLSV